MLVVMVEPQVHIHNKTEQQTGSLMAGTFLHFFVCVDLSVQSDPTCFHERCSPSLPSVFPTKSEGQINTGPKANHSGSSLLKDQGRVGGIESS